MVFMADIFLVFKASHRCDYLRGRMRCQSFANQLPHDAFVIGAALAPSPYFI
jgi:hypothetical protein